MSSPQEATRSVLSRSTESPRTILAFHAVVIGLILSFTVGVTTTLAVSGAAVWMIPWVVGVGFLGGVGYAAAVFLVAKDDPSKLMLGQVTGTEYAEIQRVVLGDSSSGEHATPILGTPHAAPGVVTVLDSVVVESTATIDATAEIVAATHEEAQVEIVTDQREEGDV
ncbi:hypothetical protein [Pimelobacter sp. 30-1]|uniref:hypothetical protein n=1 Tax=Pimelobacter sp. 30-1 TaxID=2004991 RepID=UPI001C04BC8F|nr:hypothetical protein [Pimelobacter sp. 30-1]MBU2696213.1 hypothetical protein [Pimelobacter sp. 30-1]